MLSGNKSSGINSSEKEIWRKKALNNLHFTLAQADGLDFSRYIYHVNIYFVVNIRIIFRLTENQTGNLDILLKVNSQTKFSFNNKIIIVLLTSWALCRAELSRCIYNWLSTSRKRLVDFLLGCSNIAWKFTGSP